MEQKLYGIQLRWLLCEVLSMELKNYLYSINDYKQQQFKQLAIRKHKQLQKITQLQICISIFVIINNIIYIIVIATIISYNLYNHY